MIVIAAQFKKTLILMWTQRHSGKINQRSDKDTRTAYERDRTRAIHSPAFRRLQGKTQILGTRGGDFHRTRLTHSLEVASIGQSIVHHLARTQTLGFLPADDLISVICLLHDIGHPAFGHGGEAALNFMMRDHGGFEGNAQTLRLLTKLENSYGRFGLDLTRRTLLGILKYPVNYEQVLAPIKPKIPESLFKTICINQWLPPKAYYASEQPEVDWLLAPFTEYDRELFQSLQRSPHHTTHGKAAFCNFDCSIMNNADDIAYGVHDLEDAIHLRLITREQLDNTHFRELLNAAGIEGNPFVDHLFSSDIGERKQAIGDLVNFFITSVFVAINHPELENALLRHKLQQNPEAEALLEYLKTCVFKYVINSPEARIAEFSGQNVVLHLFEALNTNPKTLLDNTSRAIYDSACETTKQRTICDYIANMTDDFAYQLHQRLFGSTKPYSFY